MAASIRCVVCDGIISRRYPQRSIVHNTYVMIESMTCMTPSMLITLGTSSSCYGTSPRPCPSTKRGWASGWRAQARPWRSSTRAVSPHIQGAHIKGGNRRHYSGNLVIKASLSHKKHTEPTNTQARRWCSRRWRGRRCGRRDTPPSSASTWRTWTPPSSGTYINIIYTHTYMCVYILAPPR